MYKVRSSKGFTLIELLAVLTILAIIVGIAAPAIFKMVKKGKDNAARVAIGGIEQSLNAFNLDCGYFPSTEQGLEALLTAPTIGRACKNYDADGYFKKKEMPKDPWNNDFVYVNPGKNNTGSYDLSSAGADGLPDTEDDIVNWKQ